MNDDLNNLAFSW